MSSLIQHLPPSALPPPVLHEVVSVLEAISMLRPLGSDPPRLFEDWAGPQRACAERELDLGTLAAQPFSSPTGSKTNSPKRALQVGFFSKHI